MCHIISRAKKMKSQISQMNELFLTRRNGRIDWNHPIWRTVRHLTASLREAAYLDERNWFSNSNISNVFFSWKFSLLLSIRGKLNVWRRNSSSNWFCHEWQNTISILVFRKTKQKEVSFSKLCRCYSSPIDMHFSGSGSVGCGLLQNISISSGLLKNRWGRQILVWTGRIYWDIFESAENRQNE